jgi:hypothetical protein
VDVIQIILAVAIGLYTWWRTFGLIFSDDQEAADAAGYWMKPGIVSLLDGDYIHSQLEGRKFAIWISSGATGGFLGYLALGVLRALIGW